MVFKADVAVKLRHRLKRYKTLVRLTKGINYDINNKQQERNRRFSLGLGR